MESVSKVIRTLMRKEPFYGFFASSLNREWSTNIDTAAVCLQGINFKLLINKDFWESIDENERIGTIKHELLHLAFYHVVDQESWLIKANGNHELLNVAMDLEVQSYIDEQYWGDPNKYAAEGIFKAYPTLQKQQGTQFYIDFLRKESEKQNNTLQSQLGKGTKDDHGSFGQASGKESVVKSQIEFQMKEAAEQTIKSRGSLPGELQDKLKAILEPKPPVFNWKALFRRMLGFSYDIYYKKTRRKESNRFEDAYGLKHNKKHSILVAIDTSGSVSNPELAEFFQEIKHIWKAGANIEIIECDMDITNRYMYKGKMPEYVTGRGGTSFLPAIEYYNENRNKYNTMVYFTDGYGDQDECKPFGKVIWIITSNGYQQSDYPGVKVCIPKNSKR